MKRKTKYEERNEEVIRLLPAPITEVQVQKKNSHRYSLFSGSEFLVGVSESTYTKLNLKKGVVITPSLFDEILSSEEEYAARDYFFRILSRRDHSRKELKDKAYKKGYSGSYIDDILDEFEQKGYIDDRAFARAYTEEKFKLNSWGPHKIRTQLFKKGIKKEIADACIAESFGEEDVYESMRQLIEKKRKRYLREPQEKRRKKVFDFLMRKGYDSENILKYMDELLALIGT